MAAAVGVSTSELSKMMEQGQLISTEVLPKFSAELRKVARQGGALTAGQNTIGAALGRMRLAWLEFVDAFSEGGGKSGIVSVLDRISDLLIELKPVATTLGKLFDWLGKLINFAVDALKKMPFLSGALTSVKFISDQAASTTKSPTQAITTTKQNTSMNVTMNITSSASAEEVGRDVDRRLQRMWRGVAAPTS